MLGGAPLSLFPKYNLGEEENLHVSNLDGQEASAPLVVTPFNIVQITNPYFPPFSASGSTFGEKKALRWPKKRYNDFK